jgi:CheY-like chemotaxis protein
MGYPRLLHLLIVEDETDMVEAYRGYLDKLRKTRPIGQPCIVQSYEDAVAQIAGTTVFHLIVLDLRLPDQAGAESDERSARGLELVQQAANREHSPIPGLIIVTGDPRRITKLSPLQKQLAEGFSHGEIITKGLDLMEDLANAIDRVLAYVDVGLIVRDPLSELRPVLTLRDEDLLRRAAMKQAAVGIELSWWTAHRDLGSPRDVPRWKKILQGRFLLPADGFSRSYFFKLEVADDGARAYSSAVRLDSKLQHIKVVGLWKSEATSLLVTGKAGPSDAAPLSISEFLSRPPDEVLAAVEQIANDIATQLRTFPKTALQEVPLRSVLWLPAGVDRRQPLVDVWRRWGVSIPGPDPAIVFGALLSSEEMIWVQQRSCHGDLHTGNVSLDQDGGATRAFIIDAGALKTVPCSRDFAALEVSLILHEDYRPGEDLLDVSVARRLFDGTTPLGDGKIPGDIAAPLSNVLAVVSAVRRQALQECRVELYAILLMDEVLMQLGGLAFGSTQNRIKRPLDAAKLFGLLASWLITTGAIRTP